MIHMESIKISATVALGTDTGLILIMFLGLFHLRRHGGGTMALGHLLWNQVGLPHFVLGILLSIRWFISVHKGIMWLLLATVVGVTPTVNLSQFFHLALLLIAPFHVGVHLFAFEWYFLYHEYR
jgi:hypothetical protein